MADRGPMGLYERNRVPDQQCPRCGRRLNRATSAFPGQTSPKTGDLTICIGCACPLRFQQDLTLRLLEAEEIVAFDPETAAHLARMVRAIQTLRAKRN